VARILHPASKASYGSRESTDTVSSTVSEILKVQDAYSDELDEAMDTLSERQKEIAQSLGVKHLWEGSLILTRCDFHPCLRNLSPSPIRLLAGQGKREITNHLGITL
jgi:hypothetical protein